VKSGFVEGADLVKLCGGYEQGAAQFDFLRRMGLKTFPGRDGHPVVTWEAVHRVQARQAGDAVNGGAEPNFAALHAVK
jgi:hypothetical protein